MRQVNFYIKDPYYKTFNLSDNNSYIEIYGYDGRWLCWLWKNILYIL